MSCGWHPHQHALVYQKNSYLSTFRLSYWEVCDVGKCLLNKSEFPSLVQIVTSEISCCVFDRAMIALDECCKAVSDLSVKPPTLCISGIDHFQNAVVFAKVQADEGFDRLHIIASMLLHDYLLQ